MAATLCGSPMYMVSVFYCVCVSRFAAEVILKFLSSMLHKSPCSGSLLVTFAPSGPRGHHVPELRRQGRPVEHRDSHLPVSGRQAAIPGNYCAQKTANKCVSRCVRLRI